MCSLAEQQQAAEKKGRLTGKQFFQSQEAEVGGAVDRAVACIQAAAVSPYTRYQKAFGDCF